RDLIDPRIELGGGRQLAVQQQIGGLQERALFRELLDGIPAVAQNPLVAVDVGDGAAAGRRVHEGGVVAHQAEVVGRRLDLPQIGGADRPLLNRNLVTLAGAIVDDGKCVLRHYGVLNV